MCFNFPLAVIDADVVAVAVAWLLFPSNRRLIGPAAKSPRFSDWFVRFIAHFVRVYEREAPRFARESLRWSEDPVNIAAYVTPCQMSGLLHYCPITFAPLSPPSGSVRQ
jgi:hypothetical protein